MQKLLGNDGSVFGEMLDSFVVERHTMNKADDMLVNSDSTQSNQPEEDTSSVLGTVIPKNVFILFYS